MVTKRRANHALKWAQKKLNLSDWRLSLQWKKGAEVAEGSVASTLCEPQLPHAYIIVDPSLCEKASAVRPDDNYDPIAALFHELSHVFAEKLEIEIPGMDIPRRFEQMHNIIAELLFDLYCRETGYAEKKKQEA